MVPAGVQRVIPRFATWGGSHVRVSPARCCGWPPVAGRAAKDRRPAHAGCRRAGWPTIRSRYAACRRPRLRTALMVSISLWPAQAMSNMAMGRDRHRRVAMRSRLERCRAGEGQDRPEEWARQASLLNLCRGTRARKRFGHGDATGDAATPLACSVAGVPLPCRHIHILCAVLRLLTIRKVGGPCRHGDHRRLIFLAPGSFLNRISPTRSLQPGSSMTSPPTLH